MKTEDELDAEIAKLFDEVTTTKVEMVKGKPRISDQATLDQMEREEAARRMEEACGMFLTAERRFQKLSDHPDKVTNPKVNVAWWEALEQVYERERVVWRLFVGPQPTMTDNKLYAKFRELLLKGSKLNANA
jgi:hypothetical protein